MTANRLVFLDTETTGLDPRVHDAWEVCWWVEDEEHPITYALEHSLVHADRAALEVSGYWTRDRGIPHPMARHWLTQDLLGSTLVAANPAFDAAFLTKYIGTQVWHYRMVDVCTGAMWLYGWDRPRSLLDTATHLRAVEGYEIPEPDHTAEGDVRTVRAVYEALRHVEAECRP